MAACRAPTSAQALLAPAAPRHRGAERPVEITKSVGRLQGHGVAIVATVQSRQRKILQSQNNQTATCSALVNELIEEAIIVKEHGAAVTTRLFAKKIDEISEPINPLRQDSFRRRGVWGWVGGGGGRGTSITSQKQIAPQMEPIVSGEIPRHLILMLQYFTVFTCYVQCVILE